MSLGVFRHTGVMDLGDGPGLDLLAGGGDELGHGERALGAMSRSARKHRRAALGTAALVLLVGAGGNAYVRAHPSPLPVPQLTVRATGVNAAFGDLADLGVLRGALPVVLVLTVRATDRAGETIDFLGLSGGGVHPATQQVSELRAPDESDVEATSSVDCQRWSGLAGVRASFRLVRDGRTRDVSVPVDEQVEPWVVQAVAAPCAQYAAAHPLVVSGVAETLDPVLPIVHLVWAIQNPTDVPYVLDGAGSSSMEMSPMTVQGGTEPAGMGAVALPPHSRNEVRTTLVVGDCGLPSDFAAGSQVFSLSGYQGLRSGGQTTEDRSVVVELPEQDTARGFELAKQACAGSMRPSVRGVDVTVLAAATGSVFTANTTGRLAQPNGSGPAVPTDSMHVWLASPSSYYDGGPADRYGEATGQVDAQGRFSVSTSWTSADCRTQGDLTDRSGQVDLVVRGAREYPYRVPIGLVTGSPARCTAGNLAGSSVGGAS